MVKLFIQSKQPNDELIKNIYNFGIRSFDVASLKEIKLVKSLISKCKIYYMNPIKSYSMIQKSYYEFGVRDFSFDCGDELEKYTRQLVWLMT